MLVGEISNGEMSVLKKRNRVKFQLLGLFLFVLFLVGCDPSAKDRMEFYDRALSVNLSDEKIKSISINSSENKVKAVFGKPDLIDKIEKPKSTYYIYGKNETNYDIDFLFVNGEVKRYFISSGKYSTSKGISEGSSKKDVIKAYGENFYERTDSGATIIGYFDKENKINIEFGMSNDKVDGIIIADI